MTAIGESSQNEEVGVHCISIHLMAIELGFQLRMAFTSRSADVRHGYTARPFRVEQQRSARVFKFRQLGATARLSSLLFHLFAFSHICEFIPLTLRFIIQSTIYTMY